MAIEPATKSTSKTFAASFLMRWRSALMASEHRAVVKLVGFVLSTHMNGDGGSCWPSVLA